MRQSDKDRKYNEMKGLDGLKVASQIYGNPTPENTQNDNKKKSTHGTPKQKKG